MALSLIYGRDYGGKSENVLDRVCTSGALLIVPETYTLAAEQRLASKVGAIGLGGAEVLSFLRLSHTLLDRGPFGGDSLDPAGKIMALAMIAEKNKQALTLLQGSASRSGFSADVLKLINECKRYAVTCDDLIDASERSDSKILSDKLHDIGLLYADYQAFLDGGYTDREDDLPRLAQFLSTHTVMQTRDIFIDKFSSFTTTEYHVIGELMKQCRSVTVTLPCDEKSFEFQFFSTQAAGERLQKIAEKNGIPVHIIHQAPSRTHPEFAHLDSEYFSFEPKEFSSEPERLLIFTARDIHSEVERTAREILSLVRSGRRFCDITVVVRNTTLYAPMIKSVFSSFHIPFTDTERLPAISSALSLYVTSAVDVITSGFSFEALFRYLKNGFSKIPPEDVDVLENYMLATGLYGSPFANDERWQYRTELFSQRMPSEEDTALLEKVNGIRFSVLSVLAPLSEALKGPLSAEQFCRALYDFFASADLSSKIEALAAQYETAGAMDDAAQLFSVYNCLISTMDSLIACAGDAKLSAKRWNDIFTEGLTASTLSILPSSADCVNFIGATKAKGTSAPIVFLLGLNDGLFPAVPVASGLLTDADRFALKDLNIELAPDSEHLNYEELSLLYGTLTIATERLDFSYPLHGPSGDSLLASSVITTVRKCFPRIREENDFVAQDSDDATLPLYPSAKELVSAPIPTLTHLLEALNIMTQTGGERVDSSWLSVYGYFLEKHYPLPPIPNSFALMTRTVPLSPEITNKLFPDYFKTSVSHLETYAACPFRYYMQYVLKARPRKRAEFSPADTGSILHFYVDSMSRYIRENGKNWHTVTEQDMHLVTRETTKTILEGSSYYLKSTQRALYLLKRLETLSFKMLCLIKTHFTCGRFEPLGSEIVFGAGGDFPEIVLPVGGGHVKLIGKIDRADVLHTDRGDFVRVVDYKSGKKTFSLSRLYHGFDMQLSVYLLALSTNVQAYPAGMLYFHLDDPIVSSESGDAKAIQALRKNALRMSGLLLDDAEVLEAMDEESTGKSEAFPFEKSVSSDGALYKGALPETLATPENFDALFSRIKKVIAQFASEMKKGHMDIRPKTAEDSPCLFCDYRSVCGGHEAQKVQALDKKTPWVCFAENNDEQGGER